MEVFTDVAADSFRIGFPHFRRPTGTKANFELCIAVTSKNGKILTALYSVLVTLLFIVCWKLVCMVVMSLSHSLKEPMDEINKCSKDLDKRIKDLDDNLEDLDKYIEDLGKYKTDLSMPQGGERTQDLDERKREVEKRKGDVQNRKGEVENRRKGKLSAGKYRNILRCIALVGFWNSREPLEAFHFMIGYLTWLRGAKSDRGSHTRRPALMLLVLAAVWLLGTYAASIFVAAELIAGNVAPANPSKVYVPKPEQTGSADTMRLQALRAPATLRSLGSAEAADGDHTIRDRFSLVTTYARGDSPYQFVYNYTVKAEDMGLQKWYDLKQEVDGWCKIEDSWFSENDQDADLDVYRPWGLANKTVNVIYDGERKTAPSATAIPFPYADASFFVGQAVEHRYGIIVHSSHRASHRPGTDPWYETETFTPSENEKDAQIVDPPTNRVKGGRPALSCTQTDVWSYNGTQFKNIFELTDEANIDFPEGWVAQLQMDFLLPRVIDVINSAGSSSLVSSTTFVGGRFDAETSKIEKDMKRLFTATWISSAHTFRNMLMVGGDQNIPNAALTGKEKPQSGVDLFVVSTPKVATLRLSVLFAIPALLWFFTLLLSILVYCGKGTWYDRTLFAEGAYQFALREDPETFEKEMRLRKGVKKCVKGTQQ